MENIGYAAFSDCVSLVDITIPKMVSSVGNYLFYGCISLTSVIFAEGSQLKSIGICAFSYCTALTSIVIPGSVTSIGSSVFGYSTLLTNIEFDGTIEQWNNIMKSEYWNNNAVDYTICYHPPRRMPR